MNTDKTYWWMLQLQLPYRPASQQLLFTSQIPRPELLEKVIAIIPQKIRAVRGESVWGLADLQKISDDLWTFFLTVRPSSARIAEEPEPGHLEETIDPRYFTLCVFYKPAQIIVVHRSSDVSRFARSANTFADIYQNLISKSIRYFDMEAYYTVEVEPIAQIGSFIEWVNSIDALKKITIKYTGPNLPSGAGNLITELRETANRFRVTTNSSDVELSANNPKPTDTDIKELDEAVSQRKLKMRARGVKAGVGTSWSSKTKPIPETAIMPVSEEELEDSSAVAHQIEDYISARFSKDQIEE